MFYYDWVRASTTNATPSTESNVGRFLTVANQRTAAVTGFRVGGRHTAAGSILMRLKTLAVASTGGTAQTPGKRDPDAPAAATTAFNDATAITTGTTPTTREIAGASGQGGYGGWFAGTPEEALTLKPNGGANGNADVTSLGGVASVAFDVGVTIAEL